jgi:DNA-binding transcriptional LysR family regulator
VTALRWMDPIERRLKLRDLHVLLAVAHAGSMGKAAARLAVSQPAVSQAITHLEHTFGVRLFDRTTKGVEPTAYGDALIKSCVVVFDDLRQGIRALESIADPAAGDLAIGATEPMAAGFVSTVIERLALQHPR